MNPDELDGLLAQLLAGGTNPLARIGDIKAVGGEAPDIAAMPEGGKMGDMFAGAGGEEGGGILDWMKGKLGIGGEKAPGDNPNLHLLGPGVMPAPASPAAGPPGFTYAAEPAPRPFTYAQEPRPTPAPTPAPPGFDPAQWALLSPDEQARWYFGH